MVLVGAGSNKDFFFLNAVHMGKNDIFKHVYTIIVDSRWQKR